MLHSSIGNQEDGDALSIVVSMLRISCFSYICKTCQPHTTFLEAFHLRPVRKSPFIAIPYVCLDELSNPST